ncbi:MAG TPA: DUF3015 domain-containing protein [Desulfobacteraceae bacterium]|nr:DUF3015 domain-containing protein [Desulfobacteraceae bacterium]
MKKFITASFILSAMAMSSAHAAPNNVGCGLGSMVFEGKSGIPEQVLAATTNGTFGNQTFGISSGTLGCAKDGVVQKYAAADAFTGANMEKLARDMSVGEGEALETMAELMGIADEHKASFFQASKDNFSKIFSSENVTSEQVLTSLNDVMASDQVLSQYAV